MTEPFRTTGTGARVAVDELNHVPVNAAFPEHRMRTEQMTDNSVVNLRFIRNTGDGRETDTATTGDWTGAPPMNIVNALERVRDRLVENDARPATLKLVDSIAKTASTPGADRAQVRSLTDLVRRLMRTPVANQNVGVYDDLAVLEEQLEGQTADFAQQRAEEEARPMPKSRKHYKQLKEKEEQQKQKRG